MGACGVCPHIFLGAFHSRFKDLLCWFHLDMVGIAFEFVG